MVNGNDLIENVWAKGFARFVLPTLAGIFVGSAGWAFTWGVNKFTSILESHGEKIENIDRHTRNTSNDVKSFTLENRLRFDQSSKDIGEVSKKLDNLDTRTRNLEIKVRP